MSLRKTLTALLVSAVLAPAALASDIASFPLATNATQRRNSYNIKVNFVIRVV